EGEGDQLAECLLKAAMLVSDAPGCELWLVHRDSEGSDTLRVSEVWAGPEQRDAALNLPEVQESAAQVMQHLDHAPEIIDSELCGGARVIRGDTGAAAFAILD